MLNKSLFIDYFLRLLIVNFFSLIFLYDTDSFNQGLISLQSLIYSLNSILTFFFIILEFTASLLQFYGFDYGFLKLIFLDIKSLNFLYIYEIIITSITYFFFLIFTFLLIYFRKYIIKNLFNLKLLILTIFIFIFFLLINIDFSKKFLSKIYNLNKSLNSYSFFRNDNWFLYYKYESTYSKKKDEIKKKVFINNVSSLIDKYKYNNFFIIINESYPNFKNTKIKKDLLSYIYDQKMLKSFEIKNYITDWSKNYSTQGAELKLFCYDNSNFTEFKNKNLKNFIKDNNCYLGNFEDFHKVFIHSYLKDSFNRSRYDSFFDRTYFFKDLKSKNLDICEGRPFTGYCDHQLIQRLNEFKKEKKNLIIYLTVNNHIPAKLIKFTDKNYCKENFPLNIHDQFCFIHQNQILFNQGLKKFIKTLSKGDFLIYYSDTPPIFPNKHRIHFEDYIDVYTFEKK